MNPRDYQFDLPAKGKPTDVILNETWYPGIQAYWERSTRKRSVDPILGVVAVVIHATAGSSSAGAVSVMKSGTASWHWLVPDEDEPQHGKLVWACAPEARSAQHVRGTCKHPDVAGGRQGVNAWSLGVEVVNALKSSDDYSDWQLRATADIVRYCWVKYPNLKHVVSHAKLDPTRRDDPGKHFEWMKFRGYVLGGTGNDGVPAAAQQAVHASSLPATCQQGGCCCG